MKTLNQMQKIKNIPDNYRLTRWFAPIYEAYSVKSFPLFLDCPQRLKRVLNIAHKKSDRPLLKGLNTDFNLSIQKKDRGNRPRAFIAFSGGKDCLAAAIKAEEEGYAPTLVHIRGINISLTSEYKHAEKLARRVGYPLKQVKVSFLGKKDFNEHPLRNLLILCILIDEGLKEGCLTYSLGNIFEDETSHANIDFDLSDGIDMLKAFEYFMKGALSTNFTLKTYVCNTLQSFYTIWKKDKGLIPLLTTCCTPDFRKPMIRKRNIEKYGEGVLSLTGCGGCYKCAQEYLFKVKFGLISPSALYNKRAVELIQKFASIHKPNFKFDKVHYNRYGGVNSEDIQVLCDRIGYYIGCLEYDKTVAKWFTNCFLGHHHYKTREEAEKVCTRFKTLYKL